MFSILVTAVHMLQSGTRRRSDVCLSSSEVTTKMKAITLVTGNRVPSTHVDKKALKHGVHL